jgi:DNA-directed RNA polymerase specialized sigma24 family protein
MRKNWVLSQEAFDALLNWLDADREKAAARYEEIRRNLINYFVVRHCADAEDLADETINRVTKNLSRIEKDFKGDPERYFYGVANMLWKENRRKPPPPPTPPPVDSDRLEQEYRCLEHCIQRLSAENRELLLKYYYAEGRDKIEQRKLLAENLGIAPNALRIRAYRIRASLQKCVEKCLERSLQ